MAKANPALVAFNGGLVSRRALARVDVSRMRFSAETQTNWTPSTVGSMMLRPGTKFIASTRNDTRARFIPFIFANDDTALIELSGGGTPKMRVWVNDALVDRQSVSTTITNGDFSASAGWTLSNATISGGVLTLTSPSAGTLATCVRSVTVTAPQINREHAIRIVVERGPVGFRIGTTSGGDQVMALETLGTGEHSLTFRPGATTIYVQYESSLLRDVIVDSGTIEASGTMEIDTPWENDDLRNISFVQSGDVIFLACDGHQQRKIERRATGSWSLVLYQPDDGPFRPLPFADVLITPSDTTGNITLTASRSIFRQNMVGSLLRFFNTGQSRQSDLTTEDTYTTALRISGAGDPSTPQVDRGYTLIIEGTYTGRLTIQRSFDGPDSGFIDVRTLGDGETGTFNEGDSFNNSIVYYRVGFKAQTPDPTGTASVSLSFSGGGDSGVVRITEMTNGTSVEAEVLKELSSTAATREWREGEWSEKYGYPTAVTLYEGRLWWFGRDRIIGSVSDALDSFDEDLEGEAGPINRTIGFGPIDKVLWALPLARLLIGLGGSEASVRSSNFDAPITPTDFAIRDVSTQGSAEVPAIKIDSRGIFVQKSKRRIYQLAYDINANDYQSNDLTVLLPDIEDDLVWLAARRQPDTHIYAICSDGCLLACLFEPTEEVFAWYDIDVGGIVEDVAVLPGDAEDQVYLVVQRTINGDIVRYIEKFALESNCTGRPVSHCADSHLIYVRGGVAITSIPNLDHLEGEEVVVWAWNNNDDDSGRDLGTYTVVSGEIVPSSLTMGNYCIGLPYTAQFKSSKLAYGAQAGSALTQKKRINYLGLILFNTHKDSLEFGQDFTRMDKLPLVHQGTTTDDDHVFEEFDEPAIELPGRWESDARLCLRATAPKPATIAAAVIGLSTHEKI